MFYIQYCYILNVLFFLLAFAALAISSFMSMSFYSQNISSVQCYGQAPMVVCTQIVKVFSVCMCGEIFYYQWQTSTSLKVLIYETLICNQQKLGIMSTEAIILFCWATQIFNDF